MPLEKHLTIDITNLGVLRIACLACKASLTVPVTPNYQPPERCPNPRCTATWFFQNSPEILAFENFVTLLAQVQQQKPDWSARIQFMIPASE
jgi:hypothetical protein